MLHFICGQAAKAATFYDEAAGALRHGAAVYHLHGPQHLQAEHYMRLMNGRQLSCTRGAPDPDRIAITRLRVQLRGRRGINHHEGMRCAGQKHPVVDAVGPGQAQCRLHLAT